MSGEEEFEVLVSSEDYLKLESRCQELLSHQQKLESQNKELSLKMIELKEENASHLKNIASLTDNIKFLSQKGLQMAKTLMNLETDSNNLKISMVQNQLDLTNKLKNSIAFQQSLQTTIDELTKKNIILKNSLAQKQKILGVEKMSRHIQVSPNFVNAQTVTLITQQQIDNINSKNQQLQQKCIKLLENLKVLQEVVSQQNLSVDKLSKDLQKSGKQLKQQNEDYSKLEKNNNEQSQISKKLKGQLEEMKQTIKNKIKKIESIESQKEKMTKEYADEMIKIKGESEKKNNDSKILMQQIQKKVVTIKQLSDECEIIKNELGIKLQQLSESNMKIKQVEEKVEQERKINLSKVEQIKIITKQLNDNKEEVLQLKRVIKQKQLSEQKNTGLIQQLQRVIEKTKTEMVSANNKGKQELDLIVKQFKEKIQSMANETKRKQQEINLLKKMVHSLQSEKSACQQKISCLAEENKGSLQQVKRGKDQIDSVRAKMAQLTNNSGVLQNQIENMTIKQGQLDEMNGRLRHCLEQRQVQKQMLIKQIINLKQKLQTKAQTQIGLVEKLVGLENEMEKRLKKQDQQSATIEKLKLTHIEMDHTYIERLEMMRRQLQKVQAQKVTMERQYDEIIQALESDKRSMKTNMSSVKGSSAKDRMNEMKKCIEQYFVELGCNLSESKLEQEDINFIIGQESKSLIQAVNQAIAPFIKGKATISHSKSIQ